MPNQTLLKSNYTYEAALSASERVNWRIGDIIGGDKQLDFAKPFLPESLARVEPLSFLIRREQTVLNQIRRNDYLYIFGLVEEFILPFVLDHAPSAWRRLPGSGVPSVCGRGSQAYPALQTLPGRVRGRVWQLNNIPKCPEIQTVPSRSSRLRRTESSIFGDFWASTKRSGPVTRRSTT